MANLDSYKNAKNYLKIWIPERQMVINHLKSVQDEIQRQNKNFCIGNVTFSSVGLVGGALGVAGIAASPVTFGTSLVLTMAGVATGLTSGLANLTHGLVKMKSEFKQIKNTKTSLEKHCETTKEMNELLILLKMDIESIKAELRELREDYTVKMSHIKDGVLEMGSAVGVGKSIANLVVSAKAVEAFRITSSVDEVAKVLSLGPELNKIVPSALKDVSNGVSKLSSEALSVLAALGIIIDLGTLLSNAYRLKRFKKGRLCNEAGKLQEVINKMQLEYEMLATLFEYAVFQIVC